MLQQKILLNLDPAKILFSFNNTQNRLTDTDADDVEVIHTSTLSFTQPIGTIDFYPNGKRTKKSLILCGYCLNSNYYFFLGGKKQPGCFWDLTPRCSHQRAFEFYAESIYNPEFSAFGCIESIDDLKKEKCTKDSNGNLLMGGESNERKLVEY